MLSFPLLVKGVSISYGVFSTSFASLIRLFGPKRALSRQCMIKRGFSADGTRKMVPGATQKPEGNEAEEMCHQKKRGNNDHPLFSRPMHMCAKGRMQSMYRMDRLRNCTAREYEIDEKAM
ncbi:hypothetical protein, variant 2 [Blastomyces dermatitidis ER-3]|uniref:Uncharacterized protein n=2 Tax=Ajellomyces dermatitidis TaxID=5039 RepID=A0A0J9EMT7_AJEDA|nr:hypothetical protein, variant 2 [Blastomyces dermatitidis ER-3]KMW67603.1 hypothetical protein, variant [Blastomyces dermatitidis ATCC 18188]OAT00953.1 hypothetical protein, variant 2 [Blastomyces dermatitidis ER-3]